MLVGVPKEIKVHESRVALTPDGVSEFVRAGHKVVVEQGAGLGSAITDADFVAAGASIEADIEKIWKDADLILKVKEPIEAEYSRLRKGQILFTYLHLAASRPCTDALLKSGTTAIAYETVELNGTLPLLAPMSEVAGRLAAQVGATALQKPHGGRGVLLGGVPGVAPGKVVVIGGGVAGLNAAVIAMGMGADVTVLDRSLPRLAYIDSLYQGRIKTLASTYETVELNGTLPLLAPMSEVAGRLAAQVGATALQKPHGGRGVLLGGVPGVAPGKVVVIGGGVAGLNAAVIAMGMGADVTVLDRSLPRLAYIDSLYQGRIKTLASTYHAIDREVKAADLVVGAVLVHGAKAPKLVTNEQVKGMKPGAVLVDIAIDQGGCFEDSKPTTHAEPTYRVHDAVFYCVANMPGAVPVASTYALTNATLPYALSIANLGWEAACAANSALAKGLNVHDGKICYEAVAVAHGYSI